MKIQTNETHRYSQSVTLPPPVGTIEFTSDGFTEVTQEQYDGLIQFSQDVSKVDATGVVEPTAASLILNDEAKVEADQNALDLQLGGLKTLKVAELKATCKDLGLDEAEYSVLETKKDLIDLIVAALAPAPTVAVDPAPTIVA